MDDAPFTIAVLLYGDYPHLARRVLDPILPVAGNAHARLVVWTNDVSPATEAYLNGYAGGWLARNAWMNKGGRNYFKYPAMREILFGDGANRVVKSPYFMWFDDDSYVTAPDPKAWLRKVAARFEGGADMVGSLYRTNKGLLDGQPDWVRSRPWYAGKEVRVGHKPLFATGGWWAVRTDILYRHDWPDPDVVHNGGDEMLGELIRQQGYRLEHWKDGVAVNADGAGRESAAETRGAKLPRVGHRWKGGAK